MAVCEKRPAEVVLILGEEEAEGLRSLLGWRVGANALKRYNLQGVYEALRDAGVDDGAHLGHGVVGFLRVAG